ncbi:hypothetical protein PGIGA_G00138010 [Pangasianodon gigas]|uniref:Uncharacterized protein n=1 Tax=Pangasianodon gigas TaxID=30993 RepID=A0ACC5XK60_PANGG|nr:hypothetical protein [Pangasianodon gigas]
MRSRPETRSVAESAATESCTRRGQRDWSCSTPDKPNRFSCSELKPFSFFWVFFLHFSLKL